MVGFWSPTPAIAVRVRNDSPICTRGREAQCTGLQIQITVSSNLTVYSKFAPVAQLDRVSVFETAGWEFKSLRRHQFYGVCDVMVASEIVILFAWVRFPSFSPSLQL